MQSEPATVVLVNEGKPVVTGSLSKEKRSSPAQPDAQSGELQNLMPDEVEALWGEMGLI